MINSAKKYHNNDGSRFHIQLLSYNVVSKQKNKNENTEYHGMFISFKSHLYSRQGSPIFLLFDSLSLVLYLLVWLNPANIRLVEDVFIFRRLLQDVLIKTNMFVLALRLQKTSCSRPIYSSWPYVFKTSSRHVQDILQRYLQLLDTSSRSIQHLSL